MQNPITFLATQPAANTNNQSKSNTVAGETSQNSFKQVLSKEISENRNAPKDKPTNQVENKSIPQDSKKNTSSQPAQIEPIAEDEDKTDVIQTEKDQTNGVQLIALVESLAQFSQKISEKPATQNQREIPAIDVTTSNSSATEIASNVSASISKSNQKIDPSLVVPEQIKSESPASSSNTIAALVDKANTKFSLGDQALTKPLQTNEVKAISAAPISTLAESKSPMDLLLAQMAGIKKDTISVAPAESKIEIKNDAMVATVTDPKMALKYDLKSVVTIDPKTSPNEDLKAALPPVPTIYPKLDSMLASSIDPKSNPKTDLKVGLQAEEKKEIKFDIKQELKSDIKTEIKADIKTDIKADLKTELKIDSKSNLKIDAKVQETVIAKEQNSKIAEITPAAQNFAQQIAVSSGQINASSEVERLTPRVGTAAWNQSVGQKIVWMVAGGQQTAELTLNPPDLGPMQVVLSVNNDQANATFISAHPDVRDALESAMPKLRQMMNDAGVQLSGFSVKSDSSNPGTQFAGDRSSPRAKSNTPGTISGTSAVGATTSVSNRASGSGIVDTFA